MQQLKTELKDSDSALVQDALSDAEEHLRTAFDVALENIPNLSETEALPPIIEKYGTPSEIAAAYLEIESHLIPVFTPSKKSPTGSGLGRFFRVLADPRAWSAFFYMLFSILTGCIFVYGLFWEHLF